MAKEEIKIGKWAKMENKCSVDHSRSSMLKRQNLLKDSLSDPPEEENHKEEQMALGGLIKQQGAQDRAPELGKGQSGLRVHLQGIEVTE